MAAERPTNELRLRATSVADDLGFVALGDVFGPGSSPAILSNVLLIGGHMVSLHAERWKCGKELARETLDADLGIPRTLARAGTLARIIVERGYSRVSGSRFVRPVKDLPLKLLHTDADLETLAAIDLLVPALRSRARSSVTLGDLVTTEVPGLAEAQNRTPVRLDLRLRRLNGESLQVLVNIPNEASALILKSLSWEKRRSARDAFDIWRCLEIARRAGITPSHFGSSAGRAATKVVLSAFARKDGAAFRAFLDSFGTLSAVESDLKFTRIRALIKSVFGETA
jgi:hypothetical protein